MIGVPPSNVPNAEGATFVSGDGPLGLVFHDDHANERAGVARELHVQVAGATVPAVGVEVEPRRQHEVVLVRVRE